MSRPQHRLSGHHPQGGRGHIAVKLYRTLLETIEARRPLPGVIRSAALAAIAVSNTAHGQSAPAWQLLEPADLPLCAIETNFSDGTLRLAAPGRIAGTVELFLSKPTWHLPEGTRVGITMPFSNGDTVRLTGTAGGSEMSFSLDASLLRPWLHGLTASSSGSVIFAGVNGPSWTLDLTGSSTAVGKLYDCVQAGGYSAPPPLGTPTARLGQAMVSSVPEVGEEVPAPATSGNVDHDASSGIGAQHDAGENFSTGQPPPSGNDVPDQPNSGDPYAGPIAASRLLAYRNDRRAFMEFTRSTYNALACKALDGIGAYVLVQTRAQVLDTEGLHAGINDLFYNDEKVAMQAGANDAHRSGGCAYWQEHPNEVAALRDEAQLENTPP